MGFASCSIENVNNLEHKPLKGEHSQQMSAEKFTLLSIQKNLMHYEIISKVTVCYYAVAYFFKNKSKSHL